MYDALDIDKLILSIENSDYIEFEKLLNSEVDVNHDRCYAFKVAVKHDKFAMAKGIVEHIKYIDKKVTMLTRYVLLYSKDAIKYIKLIRDNSNKSLFNDLHCLIIALYRNNIEVAKYLYAEYENDEKIDIFAKAIEYINMICNNEDKKILMRRLIENV